MDDYESLSHSKWECKYHVVFIPKCRRKTLRREEAEFCGPALLGEGILRIHSTTGHRGDTRVHQETGRRGQTSGADESVALIATFRWPTRSGAASAAPSAALSGSQPKAPGFAGGYLLQTPSTETHTCLRYGLSGQSDQHPRFEELRDLQRATQALGLEAKVASVAREGDLRGGLRIAGRARRRHHSQERSHHFQPSCASRHARGKGVVADVIRMARFRRRRRIDELRHRSC
jgi:hypothetical protein